MTEITLNALEEGKSGDLPVRMYALYLSIWGYMKALNSSWNNYWICTKSWGVVSSQFKTKERCSNFSIALTYFELHQLLNFCLELKGFKKLTFWKNVFFNNWRKKNQRFQNSVSLIVSISFESNQKIDVVVINATTISDLKKKNVIKITLAELYLHLQLPSYVLQIHHLQ